MSNAYVWKDGAVLVLPQQLWIENAVKNGIVNYPLVDTYHDRATERYGRFIECDLNLDHYQWEHIPLEKFPKEFRMHLLLLNIH